MEFHVNHPALFIIAGIVIAVVLAQSAYFLIKAVRRSKAIGMEQTRIGKTIRTAAIFTIAPAVAIVISVITLSKKLGVALPWLRLSVVGSMSYETIAASNALQAMGQSLGSNSNLTAEQYVNVLHGFLWTFVVIAENGQSQACLPVLWLQCDKAFIV